MSTEITAHDRCRSHADCIRDGCYYAAFCGVCHGLWARARNYREDPTDAKAAFDLLYPWVLGFRKNSRGRAPGTDFFLDKEERREFVILRGVLRKRASSQETASLSSIPSSRVSVLYMFVFIITCFKNLAILNNWK